jgi:hypothetical protein
MLAHVLHNNKKYSEICLAFWISKRPVNQIQKLLHTKLPKRLQKEVICGPTGTIIDNSRQKFNLWLFANPKLHCTAIKAPARIRSRYLSEEQESAVLCINHPNEKNCRFSKQWKSGKMHKNTNNNINSSTKIREFKYLFREMRQRM